MFPLFAINNLDKFLLNTTIPIVLHITIYLFIANSTNNPLKTYYADNLFKRKLKENKNKTKAGEVYRICTCRFYKGCYGYMITYFFIFDFPYF